ncbi:MAG: hypothetical protein R3E34_07660 [Rhodocyclaceae bacterium]
MLVTNLFDNSLTGPPVRFLVPQSLAHRGGLQANQGTLAGRTGAVCCAVERDFYASVVRHNCAAVIAMAVRPERNSLEPPADAKGWRNRINRTLVLKSLRHFLPRVLLALDTHSLLLHLIERLRAPSAIERTRPDRRAPRNKGVRIAGFHFAYKVA